jgi:hypothetical protein
MRKDGQGFDDIIDFLKNVDLAYAFKKRKLRHLRSASVNNEIRYLRNNFHSLLVGDGGLFRLKDPVLSENSLEIIRGLFGNSDEASAILDMNMAILSMDRERFAGFLNEHIASSSARENLLNLLLRGEPSIMNLIRVQIAFLKQYIDILNKFDKGPLLSLTLEQGEIDDISRMISLFPEIEENLVGDIKLYTSFRKDFTRLFREGASVDIVGYGEISTVMRLQKRGWTVGGVDIVSDDSQWIWKKMPPFPSPAEVERYENLYAEYRRILCEDVGIRVPGQVVRHFRHDGFYMIYAGQEKADGRLVCNKLIQKLDREEAGLMLMKILEKLRDVYRFNSGNTKVRIGIDAQLSNWVLVPGQGSIDRVHADDGLLYIDTSSPMIRIDGVEQINTEIFIQSAASFLRPIIRKFFLQEVLDRYYDMRSVMIDIVANLYKEKRTDLIDGFIETINVFSSAEGITEKPLSRKEIDDYYSSDSFIWKFYQASRKIDRFITEKLLRKKYMFRIPGKIER